MRDRLIVTTPTELADSPLPKKPPFFSQLPKIQPQAAAHAAHIAGFHIGVDIVGKVRCTIFSGQLKEQAVILCLRPVEIFRDRIGGDWVLEAAAIGIALNHDLDKGLVDKIHLRLTVTISEIHGLAAHSFCMMPRKFTI